MDALLIVSKTQQTSSDCLRKINKMYCDDSAGPLPFLHIIMLSQSSRRLPDVAEVIRVYGINSLPAMVHDGRAYIGSGAIIDAITKISNAARSARAPSKEENADDIHELLSTRVASSVGNDDDNPGDENEDFKKRLKDFQNKRAQSTAKHAPAPAPAPAQCASQSNTEEEFDVKSQMVRGDD